MKYLRIVILFAGLITCSGAMQQVFAQQTSVSFQLFYDELSPYGEWVENPHYGYVWIPNGDPGFTPYATEGHWVFTDDGWMWVSDYPWGWAAFHYGRWDYDDSYGWFWVPDNEWGPAWVSWRRSPGYYGWAPLRPGISINISFGGEYRERNERWIFVRENDVTRRDISRHYIDRRSNIKIINNSTVIVNTRKDNRRNATYIAGPERDEVQKATRTRIDAVVVRENDKPGHRLSDGELKIYRPRVIKRDANRENPAPLNVRKQNDVKPAPERNTELRQREAKPAGNIRTGQQSESRDGKPSVRKEREKQSPAVAPQNNNRKENTSQPKTNGGETKKRKRER